MPCSTTEGCVKGTECTYDRGMCSGNTYQGCFGGYNIDVDCAALGGTCGMNRAGRPSCLFPAGGVGGTGGGGGRGGAGGAGGTTGAAGAGGRGGSGGAAGTTGAGGTGGAAAGAGGTGGAAAGTTGTAGSGGAAGTTGVAGATGTAGTGGGSCDNTLVPSAPPVPENRVAEAFSTAAATGGTIVAGIYHLTSLSLYTGAGGPTGSTGTNRSQTSRVSGSTMETVIVSGGTTRRLTFTFTPSGTGLMLNQTCPAGGASVAVSYTATATSITIYVPSNGSNLPEVQVFTLPNPLCTGVFPSSAPAIMLNRVAEALPIANATGGTLVPGTYHLTSLVSYTGPGGATGPTGNPRSQTIRVTAASGGAFTLEASIAAAMGGTGQWLVFNATTSGSTLMLTQVCPTAGPGPSLSYTATATTFALYNTSNNTIESYALP
jgi:hypothetical protein